MNPTYHRDTLIAFTDGTRRMVSAWLDDHTMRTPINAAIEAERLAAVAAGLYSTEFYTIRMNEGHDRVFLAYVPFAEVNQK